MVLMEFFCLFVSKITQSYERISTKLSGNVDNGKREQMIKFGLWSVEEKWIKIIQCREIRAAWRRSVLSECFSSSNICVPVRNSFRSAPVSRPASPMNLIFNRLVGNALFCRFHWARPRSTTWDLDTVRGNSSSLLTAAEMACRTSSRLRKK